MSGLVRGIKVVLVGDPFVGKTSLLSSYIKGRFQEEYVPTVLDSIRTSVRVGDHVYSVCLWDTAGQGEYDSLRRLAYNHSDLFIVVTDVTCPVSLSNALKKWLPQIRRSNPKANILVLGNKSDLRTEESSCCYRAEEAIELLECEGVSYGQCSARSLSNVKQAFEQGFKIALRHIVQNRKWRCSPI